MPTIFLTPDNKIGIEATVSEGMRIRTLSSRYDPKQGCWTMPKNVASLIQLYTVFSDIKPQNPHMEEWVKGEFSREDWYAKLRGASPYQDSGPFRAEQLADAELMLDARGFGLFHETGWGKTRTAIRACGRTPILVVTTKSTIYQWAEEFKSVRPDLTVSIADGSVSVRTKALQAESNVYIIGWSNIQHHSRLETYGSVSLSDKDRTPGPLNRHWGTVIFDEAHRLGDPHAKWTRAAWAIAKDADYRYALTGTPMNGRPESLWGLVHTIQPDVWPVRSKFLDRYCLTGTNPWGGFEVYGFKTETKPEFDRIVDTFTNRRLLNLQAPRRIERVVDMERKQRADYESMRENLRVWLENGELWTADNPLAKASALYQLASYSLDKDGNPSTPSNKAEALCELVEELDGQPVVAFAVHRGLVDQAAKRLKTQCRVSPLIITGDVNSSDRKRIVEGFQQGRSTVLLGTIGALAEGVDGLQQVSSVEVFLQRPWSLIQNRQAEGRLQRTGQDDPVLIYDFVSRNSIDEAIIDTLIRKEENFEDVVRDRDRLHSLLYKQ